MVLLQWFCLIILCSNASAESPWDLKQLSRTPHVYLAASPRQEGMRALYFEGPTLKGKATRVFAWYGEPAKRGPGKFPAMVLVHGGLGTAFADWVKMWNDRGYAAIALDTCGSLPSRGIGEPHGLHDRPRHNFAGPHCWDATFEQVDLPVHDQWPYHAVADIILANSLLRSFPHVDSRRIGITGISWGGYLTAITAGVDSRFRFAVPVYGCGSLAHNTAWKENFAGMEPAKTEKWLGMWDPSLYLPQTKMPMLWIDGTNDLSCPLDSLQDSYLITRGPNQLSIPIRMTHSQESGAAPAEILAFANQVVNGGTPLVTINSQGRTNGSVWASYKALSAVVNAELVYTSDAGPFQKRTWNSIPVEVKSSKHLIWGSLPAGVSAYYFQVHDDRGLTVSSPHQTLP